MKNYLVAYDVGKIQATQIQVNDDYIPSLDNMKTIKREIIKKENPHRLSFYSAPDNCGGYISSTMEEAITENELKIVAISNLDI
uniref:Uncharacterized protein n=1 Tax=Dulem virus 35 TaxID=3145753 RepID=A0AAU8B0M7_9CAUD